MIMDKLDSLFSMQQSLDVEITKLRRLDGISRSQWIQKLTLAMISELSELIDGVNFKWWKNPKPEDDDYIRDEIVDILHFFLSMAWRSGMDADELYRRYLNKNKENFDRQHGRSLKPGYSVEELDKER